MIDLCVVATLRPRLLEKTINSFLRHVKYSGDINVIVNIDFCPEEFKSSFEDVYNICDYFQSKVSTLDIEPFRNLNNLEPNFALAVKTLWEKTKSKYVFHLEEDWEFLKPIDLDECIDFIDDYIRFPKVGADHLNCLHKLALQPSLWRGDLCRELSKHMEIDKDPEKQLRQNQDNGGIDKILEYLILRDYGFEMVKDIGRDWRNENNLDKWNKNNKGKITWQKRS